MLGKTLQEEVGAALATTSILGLVNANRQRLGRARVLAPRPLPRPAPASFKTMKMTKEMAMGMAMES